MKSEPNINAKCNLNNGKSMGNIIHNEYDALGRLARSRQGSSSRLQRSYAYNVRSQLTSSSSPLFTEKIYYESSRDNGVTPCFNGDISSVSWSDKTAISRTSDMRHYDYSYDALDRLTGSRYSDYENRTGFYDTDYIYDKQGNILNLGRNNVDPTDNTRTNLVDDASFRYDGNQLMAYSDIGMETYSQDITLPDNYDAYGHLDDVVQFAYDANGNMTANTNKGIVKITYNLLNQPASIFFRDGTVIRYDYSADGKRLRSTYAHVKYNVAIPEAGIMTADFLPSDTTGYSMTSSDIYDGRYTYRSYYYYKRSSYAKYKTHTSLSRIRIDGGIVTDFSAGNPSLLFELADHQGNIRYVADASGAYITRYQYYPFGGYFDGGTEYPYLYGGKEMEKCNGLDEYDFEARNYDPALCRFNTMDPLSEKYYNISPYAYCADNPIRYVDPDGTHLEVRKYKDDSYIICGGMADKDRNVYVNYGQKNQQVIGKMLTQYSFMNDKGNAVKGAIINLSDKSGENFLSNFMAKTPSLQYYVNNAKGGQKYDFKRNGTQYGDKDYNNTLYHHRGMKVSINNKNYIASARDIGNFAAGYIAGKNDLPWMAARLGFDALETWQRRSERPFGFHVEGNPTQFAERFGFNVGYMSDTATAIRKLKSYQYNSRILW